MGETAHPEDLARLVNAIEAAPYFPFVADLAAAHATLDQQRQPNGEVARRIRTLVDSAKAIPGFPFWDELAAAEKAIEWAH